MEALGILVNEKLRGNVHLEEIKVKAEEWIRKVVWIRSEWKMELDRGRLVWELLARPSLEHAGGQAAHRKLVSVQMREEEVC